MLWFYVVGAIFIWWFSPVLLGLLISIPISAFLKKASISQRAKKERGFLTSDETAPQNMFIFRQLADEGWRQRGFL